MTNERNVNQILDTVIADYLPKLYAFCLRETRNHADADDLCQDIVTEIVYAARSLRKPGALPGWVWTIAHRTHSRWLKRLTWEQRGQTGLRQDAIDAYVCPVDAMLDKEQLQLVRREIGLLSRIHREVIVQHYLREKTCAQIAAMMDISESMVKYHLVCARQKIREGITMVRERGTTSYDPGEFSACWWGSSSYPGEAGDWGRALARKLPACLLKTAFGRPSTVQDLSIETGVPVAFLEDEIAILLKYGMLDTSAGGRYETTICIIDQDTSAAIHEHYASEAPAMADRLFAGFQQCEADLRAIGFHRSDMDWEQLFWLAPVATYDMIERRLAGELLARYPQLKTGARAWVWVNQSRGHPWGGQYGVPTDNSGNRLMLRNSRQLNELMDRPYNIGSLHTRRGDWKRAIELVTTMTGNGLSVDGLSAADEAECARLVEEHFVENRDGRLLTRIPVLSNAQYQEFGNVVDTKMPFIEAWFRKMHQDTAEILRERLPKRFKQDLDQYAYLQMLAAEDHVLEALHNAGRLPIPKRHTHAMMIVQAATAVDG